VFPVISKPTPSLKSTSWYGGNSTSRIPFYGTYIFQMHSLCRSVPQWSVLINKFQNSQYMVCINMQI